MVLIKQGKVEEFLIDFSIKNNIPVIGVSRYVKIMTYLEKILIL